MWRSDRNSDPAAWEEIVKIDKLKRQIEIKDRVEEQTVVLQDKRGLLKVFMRNSQRFRVKVPIFRMKALKEDCEKAYKAAMKMMDTSPFKDTLKTDALRLGICLNYSVFQY